MLETLWTILLGLGLLALFILLAGVALFVGLFFLYAMASLALDIFSSIGKGFVRMKIEEKKDRHGK
jgi:hypothetical protein